MSNFWNSNDRSFTLINKVASCLACLSIVIEPLTINLHKMKIIFYYRYNCFKLFVHVVNLLTQYTFSCATKNILMSINIGTLINSTSHLVLVTVKSDIYLCQISNSTAISHSLAHNLCQMILQYLFIKCFMNSNLYFIVKVTFLSL